MLPGDAAQDRALRHSGGDGHGHGAGHSEDSGCEVPGEAADAGHGSAGHVHDDPADRGKRWFQTAKGRLVIITVLLLAAAWAAEIEVGYWAFFAGCLIGVASVAQPVFAALRMGHAHDPDGG